MAGGLTGVATMMALLGFFMGFDTDLWLMRALLILTGVCMAYLFLPVQAAAFATISSAATGRASAPFSAQRQLGAALGVAVLAAALSAVGPTQISTAGNNMPNLAAYHAAFLAATVLALVGASIALAVSDHAAAATMQRPTRQRNQGGISDQAVQAGTGTSSPWQ